MCACVSGHINIYYESLHMLLYRVHIRARVKRKSSLTGKFKSENISNYPSHIYLYYIRPYRLCCPHYKIHILNVFWSCDQNRNIYAGG